MRRHFPGAGATTAFQASERTTIDYGAFTLDPDGHNVEVVCQRPEWRR